MDQNFSPRRQPSHHSLYNDRKNQAEYLESKPLFLLWGWGGPLLDFRAIYILGLFNYPKHYQIWWISAVCFIINCYYALNHSKKERVKTYVDENMGNLWAGLTISFVVLCVLFAKIGWQNCYPFFMLLYGTGTFISGKILKFTPLVVGGVASFLLAAISVWFNYDAQMLFAAAAILVSYIIPGHILQINYKKQRRYYGRSNSFKEERSAT